MTVKEFKCKCGCKRFWRVWPLEMLVDFGREGAVAGHPMLEGPVTQYLPPRFLCAECGAAVPAETAELMEAEVI